MISESQIEKFQIIYKNYFGKNISREEAYEKGIKLIQLIKNTYKPITVDEFNQFTKTVKLKTK